MLKRTFAIALSLATLLMFVACDDDDETNPSTDAGSLSVILMDTPPPANVSEINIIIEQISVHHVDDGWQLIAEPNRAFNFRQFINGNTEQLASDLIPVGNYDQMRVVLADSHTVVVNDTAYGLVIPQQTDFTVFLPLDFTVQVDEILDLVLDFDATDAITWTPGNFTMAPDFQLFLLDSAVTLSGRVLDDQGVGVMNASVEVTNNQNYLGGTLTDVNGNYEVMVPPGTYDAVAAHDNFTTVDTTYTGLIADPVQQPEIPNLDFQLTP